MKRKQMLVVVVVLLLTVMAPLLASGAWSRRAGSFSRERRIRISGDRRNRQVHRATGNGEDGSGWRWTDSSQNESEKLGLAPISLNGTLLKFRETFEGVFLEWLVDCGRPLAEQVGMCVGMMTTTSPERPVECLGSQWVC